MTINPAPLAKLAEVSQPPRPEVEVDDFDLALLRALAADARQSQRALARQIEMSPPAVADRLARLERSGVIRGYRADIDWAALGLPVGKVENMTEYAADRRAYNMQDAKRLIRRRHDQHRRWPMRRLPTRPRVPRAARCASVCVIGSTARAPRIGYLLKGKSRFRLRTFMVNKT